MLPFACLALRRFLCSGSVITIYQFKYSSQGELVEIIATDNNDNNNGNAALPRHQQQQREQENCNRHQR